MSCFDPLYRVHYSDHQASNCNAANWLFQTKFTASQQSGTNIIFDLLLPFPPDFENCLSFPPLGFPGSKNSPPPHTHTHTHTHTYPSRLCNSCLNVLHVAAERGKNQVNFLLFPVIHSTLKDVKFKQKLYTHLHLI